MTPDELKCGKDIPHVWIGQTYVSVKNLEQDEVGETRWRSVCQNCGVQRGIDRPVLREPPVDASVEDRLAYKFELKAFKLLCDIEISILDKCDDSENFVIRFED